MAVFQPHLYSRTRDFAEGFAEALAGADVAIVTAIYPQREAPLAGVTAALISEPLRRVRGKEAVLELEKEDVVSQVPGLLRSGDVVVMMGAGDIGELAREMIEEAKRRRGEEA